MPRLRLIHWKHAEAEAILEQLRSAGHDVEYQEQFTPRQMSQWRKSPPAAFIIDLSRMPSHGREIAIALRNSPATRGVPLVFCQGAPEKVEAIRALLPDAAYCDAARVAAAVKTALRSPGVNPSVPAAMMDRYRSRTAAQKLGIGEDTLVRLIDPPRDVMQILGDLPSNVRFEEEDSDAKCAVTLCFLHDLAAVRSTISRVRTFAAHSKLWILWRKKTAAKHSGITETLLRETAIALGLVDYKICSVNLVWSGLLFARRN